MKKLSIGLLSLSLAFNAFAQDQESMINDAIASLQEGIELLKDGKIDDGAEEVRWGLELIDKAKQSNISAFFPDEVGDFKGEELSSNKAMGMAITEREYRNANGEKITVTLTRMSADGGGGLMGGLGNLAQFGMMQGEKVRIGGVTGSAMNESNERKIMLNMSNNSLFNIASHDVKIDVVKGFASKFPVRDLNDALEGN